ncbi:MAG: response regulator [Planctomycetes bacterium]|nr:response regulator [Planctomycetota bacterium]
MSVAPHAGRILVADDVASARLLYATVLEREGFRVLQASDGEEAIRQVRESKPDLLILDIGMPGTDGLTVLRRLHEAGDKTPVIVITAHKEEEIVLRAAKRGVASYLTKPVNLAVLRERVFLALGRSGAETTPLPPPPSQDASRRTQDGSSNPLFFAAPEQAETEMLAVEPGRLGIVDLALYLQYGPNAVGRVRPDRVDLEGRPPAELKRILQQSVGRLKVADARKRLATAFSYGDVSARVACTELLPLEIEPERGIDLLRTWGIDEHYRTRVSVADRLGAVDHARVFAALIPLLYDSVEEVRAAGVKALSRHPLARVCAVAIAYAVRSGQEIAPAIRELVSGLAAKPRRTLFDRLLAAREEDVRSGAVTLLFAAAPQDALRIPREAVAALPERARTAFVQSLGLVREPETVDAILPWLADAADAVAWGAWNSLRGCRLKPATRFLHDRLSRLPRSSWVNAPAALREVESSPEGLAGLLVRACAEAPLMGFVQACAGRDDLCEAIAGVATASSDGRTEAARRVAQVLLA